jgi:hypothetical protein
MERMSIHERAGSHAWVAIALILALTCYVGLGVVALLWSPECVGADACPGPSSTLASIVILGSLLPIAILAVGTAASRRVNGLVVLAAALATIGMWTATRVEAAECPNVYADDCNHRGLIAVAYWTAIFLPVVIPSLILGWSRDRLSVPAMAVAAAGLVGVGLGLMGPVVADASRDVDNLLLFLMAPVWLVPLFGASIASALISAAVRRSRRARRTLQLER